MNWRHEQNTHVKCNMHLADVKSPLPKSKNDSKECTSDLVQVIHSRAAIDGFKLSPIDFSMRHCMVINLPPISWVNYFNQAQNIKVTNSGFTAIVSGKWEEDRPYVCSGPLQGNYLFSQIHFHWGEHDETGSEHAVDGIRYPLEMHVVHFKSDYASPEEALTKDDGVAIMVHLFAVDEQRNPNLDQLTAVMQFIQSANSSARLGQIPLAELVLPFDANYYLYWGAVSSALGLHRILWLVSREILPVSTSQLAEFRLLCNLDGKPLKKNSSDPFPLIDRALFLVTPILHLEDTVHGVARAPTRSEILPRTSETIDIRDAEYKSITGITMKRAVLRTEQSGEMRSRTVNIHQQHTIKSKYPNNEINFKSNVEINIRPCGKRICSPHIERPYNKEEKISHTSESIEQSCIVLEKVIAAKKIITSSEVSTSEIKKKVMNQAKKGRRYYEHSYKDSKSSKSSFDLRDSLYNMLAKKLELKTTRSETRLKKSFYLHETDPSVEETCLILELYPTPSTPLRSLTNFGVLSVKQERTRLVPLGDSTESSEATIIGHQINVLSKSTTRMKPGYGGNPDVIMEVTTKNGDESSTSDNRNKKIEKPFENSFHLPLEINKKVVEKETRISEKNESIVTRKKEEEKGQENLLNFNKYKSKGNEHKEVKNSEYIIDNGEESNDEQDFINNINVGETESSQTYGIEFYKQNNEHSKERMIHEKSRVVRVAKQTSLPNVKYETNEPIKKRKVKVYYKTPVMYKTTEDRRPHICYMIYEPLTSPKLTEILKVPVNNKNSMPDSRYRNMHFVKRSVPSKPSLDTTDGIRPTHPTERNKKSNDKTTHNKMYRRTKHKYPLQGIRHEMTTDVPLERRQSVRDSEVSLPKPISFILKQKNGSKKDIPLTSTPESTSKEGFESVKTGNVVQKEGGAKYYITSIKEKTSNMGEENINTNSKAAYVVNFPAENSLSIKSKASENKVEITEKTSKSSLEYVNLQTESMVLESTRSPDINKGVTDKVKNDARVYTYKFRNGSKFENREKDFSSDQVLSDKDEKYNRNVCHCEENESRDFIQKIRSQNSLQLKDNEGYIILMPLEEFKIRKQRNIKERPNKYIKIVTEVVTGTRSNPRKNSILIKNSIKKASEADRVLTCVKNKTDHYSQSNRTKHGVSEDVVNSKNVVRGKIWRFKEVNNREQVSETLSSKHTLYSAQSSMSLTVVKRPSKVSLIASKSENSLLRQNPYRVTGVVLKYPEAIAVKSESVTISTECTSSEDIYEESTTFTSETNKSIYIKKEIYLKNNIVDKSKESIDDTYERCNKSKQLSNTFFCKKESKEKSGIEINYEERVEPKDKSSPIVDNEVKDDYQTTLIGLQLDLQKVYLNQEAKPLSNTFSEEDKNIHDTNDINVKINDNETDKKQRRNIELKSSFIIKKDVALKVDCKDDREKEEKNNEMLKVKNKTYKSKTMIDLVHDGYSTKEVNQIQIASFNKIEETVNIGEILYEETVSLISEKCIQRVIDSETKPLGKIISNLKIQPKASFESNIVTHETPIYEIFHRNNMEQGGVKYESTVTESETSELDELKQSKSFETKKTGTLNKTGMFKNPVELLSKEEIEKPVIFIVNRMAKDRLTILEALPVDGPDSTKKIATDKLNGKSHIFYRVFKQMEQPQTKFYFGNAQPPPIPECSNSKETLIKQVEGKHPDRHRKKMYVETVEDKMTYTHAYMRHKKVTVNKKNTETSSARQNHEIRNKRTELKGKEKDAVVVKENTESLSSPPFEQDSRERLRNTVTTNTRDIESKNDVEDSVLIHIRQEKTPAHHIQPTITVDCTKSKDMTASDLEKQRVRVREVDPITSNVILEQNIIPNKNEVKCLKVSAVKDGTSDGKAKLKRSLENVSDPLTKVLSVFPLLSKTEVVWRNKSMQPEELSSESIDKPMEAEFDKVGVIETTMKQIEINKGEKASLSKIACCSEYHPDTDPLSKVFPTSFSLTWPKKEAESYTGYQSPIRMYPNRLSVREFPKLQFCGHFTCKGQAVIENTGHTIRLTLNRNTDIAIPFLTGGPLFDVYLFEELNFHWGRSDCSGAEHVFDKENRCLEAQFMHYKKAYGSMMKALKHPDGVACISVTFETGGEIDEDFDDIIDGVKRVFNADTKAKFPASAIFKWLKKHLDTSQSYITYPGSLTFRPFCESIIWIVIVDAFVFCCQQSMQFRRVLGRDGRPLKNFRKPQHHNNRPIYYVPL